MWYEAFKLDKVPNSSVLEKFAEIEMIGCLKEPVPICFSCLGECCKQFFAVKAPEIFE